MMKNSAKTILLASNSPRRQELLRQTGLTFKVVQNTFEEIYPEDMDASQVPRFLAEQKASFHAQSLSNDEMVIAADTIVKLGKTILEKPADYADAFRILSLLSDKTHEVITGVCLQTHTSQISFTDTTLVEFRVLTDSEIDHYIKTFEPYDKAGAYGIQEWIGLIGIKKIQGSYFNVVGLPVERVWEEMKKLGIVE